MSVVDPVSLFFEAKSEEEGSVAPVRQLLEVIPGAVICFDIDDRVISINDEAKSLLGMSEAALVGRRTAEITGAMFGEDEASIDAIREAFTLGESNGPLTVGLRRPDGTTAWTVVRVLAARDAAGARVGVVATFLDITEQKRAEDELRRTEANWRLLSEHFPDFVQTLRPDGTLESVNRIAPKYRDVPILGRFAWDFCHRDHRAAWREQFERVVTTLTPARFEARGAYDEAPTWFEQTLIPIVDAEGKRVERVLGVARDITERRNTMARLAEKARVTSVGMLSASVAHEIMNPLTYVLGNLDFALSDRCPPGARRTKAILDAREGAVRMQQIVRDLRALGRAHSEDLFYVDVRSVLEMALRLAGPEVARHVDVRLELEEVPGVLASESRLCQVFMNLVINAVQSMTELPPDERKIVIRTRHDEQTSLVGVEIKDTGSGIEPEHLNRIFDPFFTTKDYGTGLGLSISRESVDKMGGRIEVQSEKGQGTTFTVWLPTSR